MNRSHGGQRNRASGLYPALFLATYALLAWNQAVAQETARTCGDEPTSVAITYGDFIDCPLASLVDSDIYTWNGRAGEHAIFRARALSGSVEPCLELFDPQQNSIATSDCTNNNFFQQIDLTLPADGTYTMLLQDRLSDETGDYRVLLEREYPASPTTRALDNFGLAIGASMELLIDLDYLSFPSAADETFNIRATATSGSVEPCLTLFGPDRSQVAASPCTNNAFTQEINGFQPQTAGSYLLRVEDRLGDEAGDYQLTVQCLFGTCSTLVDTLFGDDFEAR